MAGTITNQLTRVTDAENVGSWLDLGGGQGSAFNQDFVVQNAFARGRRVDNATRGFGFDNTTGIDIDDGRIRAHVLLWMGVTTFAGVDTIANGGMRIRLGGGADPDTSPWAEWNILGSDRYPSIGGWVKIVLHIEKLADAVAGTLDLSSVQSWGGNFTIADVGGNAPNAFIDSIEYILGSGGLLVDAGTGGSPAVFDDFVNGTGGEATAANGWGVVLLQNGAFVVNARITIADATLTVFNDDGQTVFFADQPFAAQDFLGLTIDLQNSSTDVDISNTLFKSTGVNDNPDNSAPNLADLKVLSTSGALDFDACTLSVLRRIFLNSACTLLNNSIVGCGQIDPTNGDYGGFLDMPGTDEYVRTTTEPQIAAGSTDTDLEGFVRVRLDDWTPTVLPRLISQWDSPGTSVFQWRVTALGEMRLDIEDGASTASSFTSSALRRIAQVGSERWVRFRYDHSAGQVDFFESFDSADTPIGDINWTAAGSPTATARQLNGQTRRILIGANNQATPENFMAGEISYAELWVNGFQAPGSDHGDLVFRADWRTGPDFDGSDLRSDDFASALTWELQGATVPAYTTADDNSLAADLDGTIVKNSFSEAALFWNVDTDPDGNLDDMGFDSAGTGHAIEFGPNTPSTITLRTHSYSGYAGSDGSTGNETIYNNSGKAITINVLDGGATPTIRNGTDASTTVVNTRTITFNGLQSSSEVRLYEDNVADINVAGPELDGVENSGTSFVHSHESESPDDPIIVQIFHLNFKPVRFQMDRTDENQVIPIFQIPSPNYQNP